MAWQEGSQDEAGGLPPPPWMATRRFASARRPIQNAAVTHADLTAARWREFSDESATRVARAVADEHDLTLVRVYRHEYAGRWHRVALFERSGMRFSLVPAAGSNSATTGTGSWRQRSRRPTTRRARPSTAYPR